MLVCKRRWLRTKFNKLRDPNWQEVRLRVHWRLHMGALMQFTIVSVCVCTLRMQYMTIHDMYCT